LIYGAGGGGKLVVRELAQNRDLKLDPVGFIDDDPAKQNMRIDGIPVLGTLEDLERLTSAWGVTDVIVSARDIDPDRLDALRERGSLLGVRVRRMRLDLDELRPAAKVLRRER
jgi:FlaA1/EpsC-like NDP-sugar epimerase